MPYPNSEQLRTMQDMLEDVGDSAKVALARDAVQVAHAVLTRFISNLNEMDAGITNQGGDMQYAATQLMSASLEQSHRDVRKNAALALGKRLDEIGIPSETVTRVTEYLRNITVGKSKTI